MSFLIFQNEKTPFQNIKTRNSSSRKYDIFPNGLTHGFCPKMPIFPPFLFLSNKSQENVFYDILERKNAVLGYKNKKFKQLKIDFFPKGLTQGFCLKVASFPIFFFQAILGRKIFFMIFQNKKTPFKAIKTRSSKSRKIDILPKGLPNGFGPKIAVFPIFFFVSNIGQENVFYDILERKKAFLGYKNKKSKKWKN